jgi:hypothetical protein
MPHQAPLPRPPGPVAEDLNGVDKGPSATRRSPGATIWTIRSAGRRLRGSSSAGCCKESRHRRAENVGAGSVAAKGESRPRPELQVRQPSVRCYGELGHW